MFLISHSVDQTQSIAAELAVKLHPGTCIALHGDLGAGKTQFVRGLVQGLGGNAAAVNSPTYILLNIYPTPKMPVFHLDAYRVGGSDDFEAIGFSELLEQQGLVVVEWASRVTDLLPARHISITIEPIGLHDRQITIDGL